MYRVDRTFTSYLLLVNFKQSQLTFSDQGKTLGKQGVLTIHPRPPLSYLLCHSSICFLLGTDKNPYLILFYKWEVYICSSCCVTLKPTPWAAGSGSNNLMDSAILKPFNIGGIAILKTWTLEKSDNNPPNKIDAFITPLRETYCYSKTFREIFCLTKISAGARIWTA